MRCSSAECDFGVRIAAKFARRMVQTRQSSESNRRITFSKWAIFIDSCVHIAHQIRFSASKWQKGPTGGGFSGRYSTIWVPVGKSSASAGDAVSLACVQCIAATLSSCQMNPVFAYYLKNNVSDNFSLINYKHLSFFERKIIWFIIISFIILNN